MAGALCRFPHSPRLISTQLPMWPSLCGPAEPEAVDLLLETDSLDMLLKYVDDKNYGRACLYLVGKRRPAGRGGGSGGVSSARVQE